MSWSIVIVRRTNLSIFSDFLETVQGVNLPVYSTHVQSFNFRSIVLTEISFDENKRYPPATQLAQFDTTELHPVALIQIFFGGGDLAGGKLT